MRSGTRTCRRNLPPFLTELDPEVAIKGSVDPLGFMIVWSKFGREVVSNLTTITSSARQFTTLLMGFHFAGKAVEKGRLPEDRFVSAFMEFEQLADYSRFAWDETARSDIRGIRRVSRYFEENNGRVTISAGRDGQIMSNQKAYGIFGLFTVAAADSGLVERGRLLLTAVAREHLENFVIPRLCRKNRRNEDLVLGFLGRESPRVFSPRGEHAELAKVISELHGAEFQKEEREFYYRHLVCGSGGEEGRQRTLWELIKEVNEDPHGAAGWDRGFDMVELREVTKRARGVDSRLADMLDKIRCVENVIGPAYQLYNFVLMHAEQDLETIAGEVLKHWPVGALRHIDVGAIESVRNVLVEATLGEEPAERVIRIAECLKKSDYAEALRLLLEHNADVMARRGGGAWAYLKKGKLEVRYKHDAGRLPEARELEDYWFNTYFINSLKSVGKTVLGLGVGDNG